MMASLGSLRFVAIPAGSYALGWRFTDRLPPGALAALDASASRRAWEARFSARRRVELDAFEIATESVPFECVMGDPYELDDTIMARADVVEAVDARLRDVGLRLPTEDELEAACGGALFGWGDEVPDGAPYGGETRFAGHRRPTATGLHLNADPYATELTRDAFKLGDGGEAICGRAPGPIAWLALAPTWRIPEPEYLIETLETTRLRPVRA